MMHAVGSEYCNVYFESLGDLTLGDLSSHRERVSDDLELVSVSHGAIATPILPLALDS